MDHSVDRKLKVLAVDKRYKRSLDSLATEGTNSTIKRRFYTYKKCIR